MHWYGMVYDQIDFFHNFFHQWSNKVGFYSVFQQYILPQEKVIICFLSFPKSSYGVTVRSLFNIVFC